MTPHATARAAVLTAALCLFLATAPPAAFAQTKAPPNGAKSFVKECSACHMAFPPEMLPRASWQKIMTGLTNHFGEDASLDPKTTQAIKAFLTSHSAETSAFGRRFMSGLRPGQAPLKITEMPVWISIHSEEVPPDVWKDPRVRSKANCLACHHQGG